MPPQISFALPQSVHAPAALPHCLHPQLAFGLDRAYCPDCRQGFGPKTPEYQASLLGVQQLLATSPTEVVEMLVDCVVDSVGASGVTSKSTPDAPVEATASGVKPAHWVELYSPPKRLVKYFRYIWMQKQKMRHVHIKGGNTKSALAIARASQVELAIKEGRCPAEIVEMMKTWIITHE